MTKKLSILNAYINYIHLKVSNSRLMRRVNLADNESMYYFQKMLENLGINTALRKAGVQDGDTVRFNDWEFDWYN